MRCFKYFPLALLPFLLPACAHSSANYSADSPLQTIPAKTPDSPIIPYNALLTYPDDWPQTVRRRQEED